jgi:hypothetical protein
LHQNTQLRYYRPGYCLTAKIKNTCALSINKRNFTKCGQILTDEARVMTAKQVAIFWDLGKRFLSVFVSLISSKVVQRIVVPSLVSPGRKSLPTSGTQHMHTGESPHSGHTLRSLFSTHLCAPSSSLLESRLLIAPITGRRRLRTK